MTFRPLSFFLPLILLFGMWGCTAPSAPTPSPSPTATATPFPSPTPPPAPTATPTPALPQPTLFSTPWDDRTPFASGLIPQAQALLTQRPQASVYHLDITLHEDMTHLEGRMEVRYTNAEKEPLNQVLFRLLPNILGGRMTVDQVQVNGQAAQTRLAEQNSNLWVTMPAPLQPGQQVVIRMTYQVTIPTTPGANYAVLATMDDVLALAHAYPMIPAYDEEIGWYDDVPPPYGDVTYSDVAYYLVRVNLPANVVTQASGVLLSREAQGDRQVLTYAAGPMRDFFLAASPRYRVIEGKVGDTVVRAYAPAELNGENEYALDVAINALKVFNDLYDIYPYTELDVMGTPTTAGGVEYPGLVVIALSLYDLSQPFFETATAHEVAHQWFYGVVGNDQIHHPWLDESLTQYNTLLYFQAMQGQAGYQRAMDEFQQRWDYIDDADIPLDLPVSAYDEAEYSGIIYGRGGLFFDALRRRLGEDAFATFQKTYYHTFAWDIATSQGLQHVAEKACQCDLSPLFQSWVYSENKDDGR